MTFVFYTALSFRLVFLRSNWLSKEAEVRDLRVSFANGFETWFLNLNRKFCLSVFVSLLCFWGCKLISLTTNCSGFYFEFFGSSFSFFSTYVGLLDLITILSERSFDKFHKEKLG